MTKLKELDEKKLMELPIMGKAPINEKEEKHLKEIAEFEFNNIEEPGLSNTFSYGTTKNNISFTLRHGEKRKVPRHVARHIENCSTPIYAWKPNGQGQLHKVRTGTKSRFQMRPIFA